MPAGASPVCSTSEVGARAARLSVKMGKAERVVSLDALRGLAILAMVFVSGGGWPAVSTDHVPWDSRDGAALHLADYACPTFVYCIGASIAVVFADKQAGRPKLPALKHAAARTLKMLVVGFFVKNGNIAAFGSGVLDLRSVRLVSVLGRLGAAYFVSVLLVVLLPKEGGGRPRPGQAGGGGGGGGGGEVQALLPSIQVPSGGGGATPVAYSPRARALPEITQYWRSWVGVAAIMAVYLGLTFGYDVPGCGRGYLGPGGNAEGGPHCDAATGHGCRLQNCTGGFMGYFDTLVLGPNHMSGHGVHGEFCWDKYKCPTPFDANGFFGVLPTVFHIFLGFTAGRVLTLERRRPRVVVARLLAWAAAWLATGLLLDRTGAIPFSKQMWSLSFCLGMSAVSTVLWVLLYLLIDGGSESVPAPLRCGSRGKWRWGGGLLKTTGQNSIALYVLSATLDPVLNSVCWSTGGDPGPHCVPADLGAGLDSITRSNTVLGPVFRGLWYVAGGHGGAHGFNATEPAACLVGGTGGIAPGPWSECSTYYTTVLLWSVLNVLLILLVGRCLARHRIMIKL